MKYSTKFQDKFQDRHYLKALAATFRHLRLQDSERIGEFSPLCSRQAPDFHVSGTQS